LRNFTSTLESPLGSSIDLAQQRAEEALVGTDLAAIRRHLHAHPELSGLEIETTAYVGHYLSEYGIPYRLGPGGVGVLSDLAVEGTEHLPIIALRADMDALPIQEENDTPYRSQHPGVMHACGHDAHTTMLLGALTALHAAGPGRLVQSRCRGIFQSSEETGQGALDMVHSGAMEGVTAIIALHVAPDLPCGTVGISVGPQTAFCQDFSISVKGVGGHAARPHLTIDPIATAAQLLTLIYQAIPRGTDMNHPVVVTVGEFLGGSCTNVIPESASLRGTVRALTQEAADATRERLRELCAGMSLCSRAEITITFARQFPGVVNDPAVTAVCMEAAQSVVGEEQVLEALPSMGGEDFADYLSAAPGCMMRLGVREPGAEIRPLHTPAFDLAEESLLVGARILLRSFFMLSRGLSASSN
jgi:amidohydrolase